MIDGFDVLEDRGSHVLKSLSFYKGDAIIAGRRYVPSNGYRGVVAGFAGLNTRLHFYDPVARILADGGFDTHLLSLRGHDGSIGTPGLEFSREDAETFLDEMVKEYGKVYCVANSLGGWMILRRMLEIKDVLAACMVCIPDVLDPDYFAGYRKKKRPVNFEFAPEDYDRIEEEIGREAPLTDRIAGMGLTIPAEVLYTRDDDIVPLESSLKIIDTLEGIAVDGGFVEGVDLLDQTHKIEKPEEVGVHIRDFFNRSLGQAPEGV
jgi:pimeloyl-ACP methyl ester carboxylesterase